MCPVTDRHGGAAAHSSLSSLARRLPLAKLSQAPTFRSYCSTPPSIPAHLAVACGSFGNTDLITSASLPSFHPALKALRGPPCICDGDPDPESGVQGSCSVLLLAPLQAPTHPLLSNHKGLGVLIVAKSGHWAFAHVVAWSEHCSSTPSSPDNWFTSDDSCRVSSSGINLKSPLIYSQSTLNLSFMKPVILHSSGLF